MRTPGSLLQKVPVASVRASTTRTRRRPVRIARALVPPRAVTAVRRAVVVLRTQRISDLSSQPTSSRVQAVIGVLGWYV